MAGGPATAEVNTPVKLSSYAVFTEIRNDSVAERKPSPGPIRARVWFGTPGAVIRGVVVSWTYVPGGWYAPTNDGIVMRPPPAHLFWARCGQGAATGRSSLAAPAAPGRSCG